MLVLKACPRCQGAMMERWESRDERVCLQCGHVAYALAPLPYVPGSWAVLTKPRKKLRRSGQRKRSIMQDMHRSLSVE
jgi:hypothetical protein